MYFISTTFSSGVTVLSAWLLPLLPTNRSTKNFLLALVADLCGDVGDKWSYKYIADVSSNAHMPLLVLL